MGNMAYCRFTNTAADVQDCLEHMDEEDVSPAEQQARRALIRLAITLALNYGEEIGIEVIRSDDE